MGLPKTMSKQNRNTVRFAPDPKLCDFRDGPEELSVEDICEIWFQRDEYEDIRLQAKRDAANGKDHGVDFYISRAYGCTDDKNHEMLVTWTKLRDTLRGLERFVSQDFSQTRAELREKLVKAVLLAQKRLNDEDEEDYIRRSRIISEAASSLSRESTEFAFMIGSADEKAASFINAKARKASMDKRREDRRDSIDTTSSTRSTYTKKESNYDNVFRTLPMEISSHKRTMVVPASEVRTSPIYGGGGKGIRVVVSRRR